MRLYSEKLVNYCFVSFSPTLMCFRCWPSFGATPQMFVWCSLSLERKRNLCLFAWDRQQASLQVRSSWSHERNSAVSHTCTRSASRFWLLQLINHWPATTPPAQAFPSALKPSAIRLQRSRKLICSPTQNQQLAESESVLRSTRPDIKFNLTGEFWMESKASKCGKND